MQPDDVLLRGTAAGLECIGSSFAPPSRQFAPLILHMMDNGYIPMHIEYNGCYANNQFIFGLDYAILFRPGPVSSLRRLAKTDEWYGEQMRDLAESYTILRFANNLGDGHAWPFMYVAW